MDNSEVTYSDEYGWVQCTDETYAKMEKTFEYMQYEADWTTRPDCIDVGGFIGTLKESCKWCWGIYHQEKHCPLFI